MEIHCPAKVNLALSVGGPDRQGMHPIASWMVCLDLADRLILEKSSGASSLDIRFDDGPGSVVAGREVDWPVQRDLAWRAWQSLCARVGRELPVRATLTKRIPTGGGLGGGSSDAAGMLVGLDRLFHLDLGTRVLASLGGGLGSDVAFLVHALADGMGSAVVSGLGERFTFMPLAGPLHLALILPAFGCPTGAVYQAFDRLHGLERGDDRPADMARVTALASRWPVTAGDLFNDLADAACAVRPPLAELRRALTQTAQRPVHVTGSGSTLFVLTDGGDEAAAAAQQARACGGVGALAAVAR